LGHILQEQGHSQKPDSRKDLLLNISNFEGLSLNLPCLLELEERNPMTPIAINMKSPWVCLKMGRAPKHDG